MLHLSNCALLKCLLRGSSTLTHPVTLLCAENIARHSYPRFLWLARPLPQSSYTEILRGQGPYIGSWVEPLGSPRIYRLSAVLSTYET